MSRSRTDHASIYRRDSALPTETDSYCKGSLGETFETELTSWLRQYYQQPIQSFSITVTCWNGQIFRHSSGQPGVDEGVDAIRHDNSLFALVQSRQPLQLPAWSQPAIDASHGISLAAIGGSRGGQPARATPDSTSFTTINHPDHATLCKDDCVATRSASPTNMRSRRRQREDSPPLKQRTDSISNTDDQDDLGVIRRAEFRISEDTEVVAYMLDRLTEMQQLSNKMVAKNWIKGICPRKQAKFPYMNRKRAEMSSEPLETPPWWPDVKLCKFTEPDHVKKAARQALLIHLLRLRPTPEQLREWNREPSAKLNAIHVREGWTAFLRSLTPLQSFDKLTDTTPEKAHQCAVILEELYRVAALEEQYMLKGIGGDTIIRHCGIVDRPRGRKRPRTSDSDRLDDEYELSHEITRATKRRLLGPRDSRRTFNAGASMSKVTSMGRESIDTTLLTVRSYNNLDTVSTATSSFGSPAEITTWSSPAQAIPMVTLADARAQSLHPSTCYGMYDPLQSGMTPQVYSPRMDGQPSNLNHADVSTNWLMPSYHTQPMEPYKQDLSQVNLRAVSEFSYVAPSDRTPYHYGDVSVGKLQGDLVQSHGPHLISDQGWSPRTQ